MAGPEAGRDCKLEQTCEVEAKYRFNSGMRKEAGGSGRPISANPPPLPRYKTGDTKHTDRHERGREGGSERERGHASTQRPMDCAMRASVHPLAKRFSYSLERVAVL